MGTDRKESLTSEIPLRRDYDLVIKGLTLEEIKEVLSKVREIEQRHPEEERIIFASLMGLEHEPKEEVSRILKEIFPERPTAG